MAPVASVFDPVAAPGVVRTEEGGGGREREHTNAQKRLSSLLCGGGHYVPTLGGGSVDF